MKIIFLTLKGRILAGDEWLWSARTTGLSQVFNKQVSRRWLVPLRARMDGELLVVDIKTSNKVQTLVAHWWVSSLTDWDPMCATGHLHSKGAQQRWDEWDVYLWQGKLLYLTHLFPFSLVKKSKKGWNWSGKFTPEEEDDGWECVCSSQSGLRVLEAFLWPSFQCWCFPSLSPCFLFCILCWRYTVPVYLCEGLNSVFPVDDRLAEVGCIAV